jgi:hypothetical protein
MVTIKTKVRFREKVRVRVIVMVRIRTKVGVRGKAGRGRCSPIFLTDRGELGLVHLLHQP